MSHLKYFYIVIKDCYIIDSGGVIKDFLENYRSAFCSEFHKEHPNVISLREGFYYLTTTPLEDDEKQIAIDFVCGCNWFVLMTGCAPRLLHPVTLFMMLCSEPNIEKDFTNAYPFHIKEVCTKNL